MRKSCFAVIGLAVAGLASIALGNAGTLLPLDQYQAGTESTNSTIVQNGGFESVTSGNPDGWTLVGSGQVAAPIGPNVSAVNGSNAAQFNLGATAEPNKYVQTVTLQPGADYVLSGYAWNFSGINYDLSLVEILNPANPAGQVRNFSLSPLDGGIDGSRGVFGYRSFNTATLGTTTLQLEVEFDIDDAVTGVRPNISAQLDNISITPEADFRAPSLVPEPTSLSILAGIGALARRRR